MPRVILSVALTSDEFHDLRQMVSTATDAIQRLFTETDLVEDFDTVTIECTFSGLTEDEHDIIRFKGESGQDD